ncbi:MAG: hypothetical protein ACXABY_22285 [Candidatus Thorarchaeota archaeon]
MIPDTDDAWQRAYGVNQQLDTRETQCDEAVRESIPDTMMGVEFSTDWRYYWVARSHIRSMLYHMCMVEVLRDSFVKERDNASY